MSHRLNPKQQGFTILELMVATSVLSILLLIATAVFISIGNTYTKGVTGSELQDNVRNIAQDVAGTAQYSVSDPVPATNSTNPALNGELGYCIGNQEYTYVLDEIQGVDQLNTTTNTKTVQHVLWEDTNPNPGSCTITADLTATSPPSQTGKDLGMPHEGLHQFDVGGGDDACPTNDLICINIDAFQAAGQDLVDLTQTNSTCKGNLGDQFCFTSQLTTTVQRRVQ